MSKSTKVYLFITFTLLLVIIPLFAFWIMFSKDVFEKEILEVKYNLIIVLLGAFSIVSLNILLIHFQIFEMKSITYILPFTIVMIALIYTSYAKDLLMWWGRSLIILSCIILALPINIIVFRIQEKQHYQVIKQINETKK